jgi:hypothetical protein
MSGVPIGGFASSHLASRVRLSLLLRATSAIAAALVFLVAVTGMFDVATVLGQMILFRPALAQPRRLPSPMRSAPTRG